MLSGVENVLMKASVSWLALMMHSVPNIPATAKNTASGFHLGPRPRSMMCMVPPCGMPRSSVPLNMVVSTPSWYLVHMPTMALTHIQKMAPGPPSTRAMATPAMLPRPTVAPMVEASACTDEICPSEPSPFRRSSRTAAGRRRSDTAPEAMKR